MLRHSMAVIIWWVSATWAQVDLFEPAPHGLFTARKTYVGAEFVYPKRLPAKPIKVTLVGNNALERGDLYVINKRTGVQSYLFRNTAPPGITVMDVTYMFAPGDTVVFRYMNIDGWDEDLEPKFSGHNRTPGPYLSPVGSDGHPDPAKRFGRRWCTVGASQAYPGELEFGFEDWAVAGSDMDFDDVVYRVSGLQMRVLTKKSFLW